MIWPGGALRSGAGLTGSILTPFFALGKDKDFPSPNYHKFNFQNIWEQDGHVFHNEHVNVQSKGTAEFIRKAAADSTVCVVSQRTSGLTT